MPVSLGPQHICGILLRLHHITGQALKIEQGGLYPPYTAWRRAAI